MKKFQYYFSSTIILISLFFVGCESEIKDPRLEDKAVSVISVKDASNNEQSFTGVVRARVESNLGFRVAGKVIHRFVNNGQKVKKGQALMEIDANDISLALKAKENEVKAIEAKYILANKDENRYKELLKVNAISQQAYDQSKATSDSLYAQLEASKAQVNVAKNNTRYSILFADADGVIVETLAEPGQVVGIGQTVIKLAHNGAREASIDLPETIRPKINSKAQAKLFGSDIKMEVYLRQLSDSANAFTRTYEARYVLSKEMKTAPLGSTVTIYLSTKNEINSVEVPLSAITDEGKGTGVWIYNDDSSTISFKKVEIASLTSETAIIKSGIALNDKIIALGAHFLHEGQKVRLSDNKVIK
jgi:RND family efflux transporter MFP subunit